MYIVIDAYNVLKAVFPGQWISADQRKAFIQHMNSYAAKKKHHLILVFDGFENHENQMPEQKTNVDVIYAGSQTADEKIDRLLDDLKNKDTLLVSSDRKLNKKAHEFNIPSIDAMLFYELVQKFFKRMTTSEQSVPQIVKISAKDHEEIDRLMHEAAQHHAPVKESELVKPIKRHHPRVKQALSAHEKKLAAILKKL